MEYSPKIQRIIFIGAVSLIIVVALIIRYSSLFQEKPSPEEIISEKEAPEAMAPSEYPLHKNIIVTTFWVGEHADESNAYITNEASAWDANWEEHFGGTDDPDNRSGFFPADFTPKENPFYFALPYNDLDDSGKRKPEAQDVVYWANEKEWKKLESMCKNRWIKISKGGKNAFAQWEDAGPFGEDDYEYVFGDADPGNTRKSDAGLDVSPAVKDYLGLSDVDKVDWQFVPESEVPDGPWKQVVTTRNGN